MSLLNEDHDNYFVRYDDWVHLHLVYQMVHNQQFKIFFEVIIFD